MLVNSDVCRVRPDSFVAFEEGVAKLSKVAREKSYERPWIAYQVLYGQTGTVGFHTLHENWQNLGDRRSPRRSSRTFSEPRRGAGCTPR
jgi:hypothetical protein